MQKRRVLVGALLMTATATDVFAQDSQPVVPALVRRRRSC